MDKWHTVARNTGFGLWWETAQRSKIWAARFIKTHSVD